MKRIYFGIGQGFDRENKAIDADTLALLRTEACQKLATEFGGFSSVATAGGWMSDTNGVVLEPSWGVEVYTDEARVNRARPVAEYLKALFRQESILLVIQDVAQLDFV